MRTRHGREAFLIVGEGLRRIASDGKPEVVKPSALQATVQFRFSRFAGIQSTTPNSTNVLMKLAVGMVGTGGKPDPTVPAGYTYLGQFIDHDLTLDDSELDLSKPLSIPGLASKRSPSLDLDSLYADGPTESPQYYEADGVHLKKGRPAAANSPNAAQDGMDLPRHPGGAGPRRGTEREANIPDIRNDENLAVAQIHTAFIRFHNQVVDKLIKENTPSSVLFERARELVTKHYQWMIVTDYLPRIADKEIVDNVFSYGRKHFEVKGEEDATMPVEFSGAAFRLGHSQVRTGYQWNKFFNREASAGGKHVFSGHLFRLFRFSGTSGSMEVSNEEPGSPEDLQSLENPQNPGVHLPDVWVADFTRLFDFSNHPAVPAPGEGNFNNAMALDAHVVEPLKMLPIGSFGSVGEPELALKRSLAFRNLARGRMLALPSGQQMADRLNITKTLTAAEILDGAGGPALPTTLFEGQDRTEVSTNTPLWFYVLREAEFNAKAKNKLTGVGATIIAETFHRAIQKSHHSILADTGWRPTLGTGSRFDMADLLFFAFEGKPELLNPHG
jgi:hypothetical protein